jgi:hypothetical protein
MSIIGYFFYFSVEPFAFSSFSPFPSRSSSISLSSRDNTSLFQEGQSALSRGAASLACILFAWFICFVFYFFVLVSASSSPSISADYKRDFYFVRPCS